MRSLSRQQRSFDGDSLSPAFENKMISKEFTRIALLQNLLSHDRELKLKIGENGNENLSNIWELLTSPFQSIQPVSKSPPGLSKQLSSQELTWQSFDTPKIGV